MTCNAQIMLWKPSTHIRPMLNSCKNQPIELQRKSIDWFLHECTKAFLIFWSIIMWCENMISQKPSVISQNGEPQNWCFKKTKHVKDSLFYYRCSFLFIELPEANSEPSQTSKIECICKNNRVLKILLVTACQP